MPSVRDRGRSAHVASTRPRRNEITQSVVKACLAKKDIAGARAVLRTWYDSWAKNNAATGDQKAESMNKSDVVQEQKEREELEQQWIKIDKEHALRKLLMDRVPRMRSALLSGSTCINFYDSHDCAGSIAAPVSCSGKSIMPWNDEADNEKGQREPFPIGLPGKPFAGLMAGFNDLRHVFRSLVDASTRFGSTDRPRPFYLLLNDIHPYAVARAVLVFDALHELAVLAPPSPRADRTDDERRLELLTELQYMIFAPIIPPTTHSKIVARVKSLLRCSSVQERIPWLQCDADSWAQVQEAWQHQLRTNVYKCSSSVDFSLPETDLQKAFTPRPYKKNFPGNIQDLAARIVPDPTEEDHDVRLPDAFDAQESASEQASCLGTIFGESCVIELNFFFRTMRVLLPPGRIKTLLSRVYAPGVDPVSAQWFWAVAGRGHIMKSKKARAASAEEGATYMLEGMREMAKTVETEPCARGDPLGPGWRHNFVVVDITGERSGRPDKSPPSGSISELCTALEDYYGPLHDPPDDDPDSMVNDAVPMAFGRPSAPTEIFDWTRHLFEKVAQSIQVLYIFENKNKRNEAEVSTTTTGATGMGNRNATKEVGVTNAKNVLRLHCGCVTQLLREEKLALDASRRDETNRPDVKQAEFSGFDRIYLSNIPDYIGFLSLATLCVPVLNPNNKDAFLESNIMLTCSMYKKFAEQCYANTYLTLDELSKVFGLRHVCGGMWGFSRWKSSALPAAKPSGKKQPPSSKTAAAECLSEGDFFDSMDSILLNILLPYESDPHRAMRQPQPHTLATFFEMLEHAAFFCGHFVFVQKYVTDRIMPLASTSGSGKTTTRVSVPQKCPNEQKWRFNAQQRKKDLCLDVFAAEMRALLRIFVPVWCSRMHQDHEGLATDCNQKRRNTAAPKEFATTLEVLEKNLNKLNQGDASLAGANSTTHTKTNAKDSQSGTLAAGEGLHQNRNTVNRYRLTGFGPSTSSKKIFGSREAACLALAFLACDCDDLKAHATTPADEMKTYREVATAFGIDADDFAQSFGSRQSKKIREIVMQQVLVQTKSTRTGTGSTSGKVVHLLTSVEWDAVRGSCTFFMEQSTFAALLEHNCEAVVFRIDSWRPIAAPRSAREAVLLGPVFPASVEEHNRKHFSNFILTPPRSIDGKADGEALEKPESRRDFYWRVEGLLDLMR